MLLLAIIFPGFPLLIFRFGHLVKFTELGTQFLSGGEMIGFETLNGCHQKECKKCRSDDYYDDQKRFHAAKLQLFFDISKLWRKIL